jgi:SAM-dependent methyltransferase
MIPIYEGQRAKDYDQKRANQPEWHREHEIIRDMLSRLLKSKVLDIPCGTGRFQEIYDEFGIQATGVDKSVEMLELARAKGMHCKQGNILTLKEGSYDAAVCMRLANWLTPDELATALLNLTLMTGQIIMGIQVSETPTIAGGATTHANFPQLLERAGLTVKDKKLVAKATAYEYSIYWLG